MNRILQTISHPPLVWTAVLPVGFRGIRLPGSTLHSATGEFGSLCIQEFHGHQYSIRFNVFDIIQRFLLRVKSTESGLHTRVMLKGHVEHEMTNGMKWALRKNQFALVQADAPEITEQYNKNLHISFDTVFSQPLVNELLPLFPPLQNKLTGGRFFLHNTNWAEGNTIESVHSILRCKYEKELRRYFFESRVRDLLFNFLVQLSDHDPAEKQATEKELQSVYQAEQIISQDISAHFRIPDLARKVLLNEVRLTSLFKKIFGSGLYEYLVSKRMKKAKELLEAGASVKEVAGQTGYRPTDFTAAFINYFGFTPGSIRKKDS
jgi:AraC-like DNA-binding protein